MWLKCLINCKHRITVLVTFSARGQIIFQFSFAIIWTRTADSLVHIHKGTEGWKYHYGKKRKLLQFTIYLVIYLQIQLAQFTGYVGNSWDIFAATCIFPQDLQLPHLDCCSLYISNLSLSSPNSRYFSDSFHHCLLYWMPLSRWQK